MGACAYFADLLEYPDDALGPRLAACIAGSGSSDDPARAAVVLFRDEADRRGLAAMQELYTAAFDLDPACTLYAGHHLFGETHRRGAFIARLTEQYRESGFRCLEHELPDYLPVLLRYVDEAGKAPPDVAEDLLVHVIVPAARRLLEALERRQNPYALVFGALVAYLEIPA